MNFLFPVLAALLQAASFTLDKVVLSLKRVNFRTYTGISFPLIFFITLVIFMIFRPPLSLELFSGKLGWLIFISAFLTIVTNLFFYRALDADRLGEIQTLDLLPIIPVIIFSSLFFSDERSFFVLVPALVASAAIIWSHWERHHFAVAKKTLPFLIWALVAAPVGAAVSKIVLTAWNPISFRLVIDGIVAVILGPLFFKDEKRISLNGFGLLLLTNILTSIAWTLFYFSYQRSGIVYTTLIFSLQPLLVYFTSLFFLKEPFHMKKFVAFIIVLASIAIAQFTG